MLKHLTIPKFKQKNDLIYPYDRNNKLDEQNAPESKRNNWDDKINNEVIEDEEIIFADIKPKDEISVAETLKAVKFIDLWVQSRNLRDC